MISDPGEPYSWQKISIEYALKMWTSRYKLPTTILRLFQVFGENQRKDTAIAAFMSQKKNNKPITLIRSSEKSKFNTGRRDWIYVKDIAKTKSTIFCHESLHLLRLGGLKTDWET